MKDLQDALEDMNRTELEQVLSLPPLAPADAQDLNIRWLATHILCTATFWEVHTDGPLVAACLRALPRVLHQNPELYRRWAALLPHYHPHNRDLYLLALDPLWPSLRP